MAAATQTGRKVADDSGIVGEKLGLQGSGPSGGGDDPQLDLSEIASGIAEAAREQTRTLLDAAKGQATSFADQRKDGAAQAIADIAESLRGSGEGFGDRPNVHAFVGTAADGLDQLATTIRDRSFAELYGEVEDFARRQPVAVGAAAVLAGFLLARFIKSSAENLSEASSAARAEASATARARGRTRSAPSRAA